MPKTKRKIKRKKHKTRHQKGGHGFVNSLSNYEDPRIGSYALDANLLKIGSAETLDGFEKRKELGEWLSLAAEDPNGWKAKGWIDPDQLNDKGENDLPPFGFARQDEIDVNNYEQVDLEGIDTELKDLDYTAYEDLLSESDANALDFSNRTREGSSVGGQQDVRTENNVEEVAMDQATIDNAPIRLADRIGAKTTSVDRNEIISSGIGVEGVSDPNTSRRGGMDADGNYIAANPETTPESSYSGKQPGRQATALLMSGGKRRKRKRKTKKRKYKKSKRKRKTKRR